MRGKLLGTEPTLILQTVAALLGLLVTFNLNGLSAEQAGLIVAAISAVFGVINAAAVRPVAPAAFTALVGALADLVAAYGFNVSPETIGAVNATVLAVLALIFRQQVTPVAAVAPGRREAA